MWAWRGTIPRFESSGDSPLGDGLDRLWTWAYDNDGTRVLEHLVPTSVGPNTIRYVDDAGQGRRWPLDEVREAIEHGDLWIQPSPVVFAPRHALAAATEQFSKVHLWLHPATRLVDGRPMHRPLHAKLLVVASAQEGRRGRSYSWVHPTCRVGHCSGRREWDKVTSRSRSLSASTPSLSLRDFVPNLVYAPLSALELQERQFPELGPNLRLGHR